MTRTALIAAAIAGLLATPAWAQQAASDPVQETSAIATFFDADGMELGMVDLTESEDGVTISGELMGLPGGGEHGFHIHETGDCDPTTGFESAGGHFEPGENQHGFDHPDGPHAGDIENQTIGEEGTLALNVTTDRVTLSQGPMSVFDEDGSALVLHAGPDDYESQPAGDSGDRIACAVIEATPTE